MIKLIASDLDGTLLDSEKNLPSGFFEVLDELERRGITFAVASGRTYSAVDHLFLEEYRKKIVFICDNGACTYYNGKPDQTFPLDRATFEELLDACDEIGGLMPVVCAESGVYHLRNYDGFGGLVGKYYLRHTETDDLRKVKGEIFKFVIHDEQGTYSHGKPALDKIFGDRLNVQVSGDVWMDVMAAGVSKGVALKALQKRLDVTGEETMTFGDYFNDLDMLLSSKWSFCPENGHEEIKNQARFICPSCDDGGVVKAIKEYAICGETMV